MKNTIEKLELRELIPKKRVIVEDLGFDASTIVIDDVIKYGI